MLHEFHRGVGVIKSLNSIAVIKPWFRQNESITKVVIPDTATKIESYAFSGCSNLVDINFPSDLVNFKDNCFSNSCLQKMQFSTSSIMTETSAFKNCGSTENDIIIPNMSVLGSNCFEKVKARVIRVGTGTQIGSDCFTHAAVNKIILESGCVLDTVRAFYLFYGINNATIIINPEIQNFNVQHGMFRGVRNLNVVFKGSTIFSGPYVLQYIEGSGTWCPGLVFFVKAGLLDLYKQDSNWSIYFTRYNNKKTIMVEYFESSEIPTTSAEFNYCLVSGEFLYTWNGTVWELVA